jgi:spore germination cell wall hydrolase CwlJ-like protein
MLVFMLAPTQIGYGDIASLLARQPAVTAHWRQHMRAVVFGTVRAASFSFFRPIGTAMPKPLSIRLASLDPWQVMGDSWPDRPGEIRRPDEARLKFPTVNRSGKGDRLPVARQESGKGGDRPPPAVAQKASSSKEAAPRAAETSPAQRPPNTASSPEASPSQPQQAAAADAKAQPSEPARDSASATEASPPPQHVALAASKAPAADEPQAAAKAPALAPVPPSRHAALRLEVPAGLGADPQEFAAADPAQPVMEMAQLYFGNDSLHDKPATIEKWGPGEAPSILPPLPPAPPENELAALNPRQSPGEAAAAEHGGETVADKGEVTGEGQRPKTPAERLGLSGKARAKAEKCLAQAIYFEARGEPERGQMAVAQVVINRVFSGYYPKNICDTVYQNADHRFACQFTFACDGIPETVDEPQAWLRAVRIARDFLDGKYWVPEIGRATHYHAYWVHPDWVHEMKKIYKIGVHTFYRPRAWGDGTDEPAWASIATAKAAGEL